VVTNPVALRAAAIATIAIVIDVFICTFYPDKVTIKDSGSFLRNFLTEGNLYEINYKKTSTGSVTHTTLSYPYIIFTLLKTYGVVILYPAFPIIRFPNNKVLVYISYNLSIGTITSIIHVNNFL
jgi:hypothetical protein